MEIYDTEEEQVAALKRWWKQNGTSTITGVIVGIALLAGWNFYQSYKQDRANQASGLYQELLTSASSNNVESTEKLSERITQQYGSTAYATFANLILAKTKVEKDDLDGAKLIFEKIIAEADSVELKNVARLRLVKILQAKGENEQGLQVIAQADKSGMTGFSASYNELKGDLYVALDRLGEARTAYESALREGSKSRLLQFKLNDIAAVEIVENTAE